MKYVLKLCILLDWIISDEFYYNYYKYYRRRMAPKVDVRIVIVATISIISIVQACHTFLL